MAIKNSLLGTVLASAVLVMLQGCGGGSSSTASSPSSTAVTGVAAVGAPISSGTISLIGANGATATSTISESGAYTLDTTGLTFPVLVRVDGVAGGESTVHYSVINEAGGVINANPVTTAIVTLAMGQDPGVVFQNATTSAIALLTSTAVANASATVTTALNSARAAAGLSTSENVNFLSGSFVANKTGLDKILDLVKLQVEADKSVLIANKTDDAVVRVAQPTSLGAIPTASGSLGTVQSVNTSAIDTLGSSFAAQFSNVAANFVSGNSAVQALFDAGFLHEGMDASAIVTMIAGSPEMNGATLLPSKVRNCTGAGTVSDNFVCDAVFTIKYSDGGLESIGFPVKRQADNTWKFFGNQAITDASVNPVTFRSVTGSSAATTQTGFNVSVRKNQLGQFATNQGGTVNKTEVYLGGSVSGSPVATLVTPQTNSCPNSTNYMVLNTAGNCGNFIEMTDSAIDTLRSQSRPKVTLRFLNSGNAELGTFTTYLEAVPLKTSEVTADRFATFTDASWTAYSQAAPNASVSIVLNKSASVALEDLVGGIYPSTGSDGDDLAFDVVRKNTTFSVKRGAGRNDLIAVTKDSAGRVFWFQRNP